MKMWRSIEAHLSIGPVIRFCDTRSAQDPITSFQYRSHFFLYTTVRPSMISATALNDVSLWRRCFAMNVSFAD